MGASTVLLVGFLVSLISGRTNPSYLDPDLISPVAHWLLPVEAQQFRGTARLNTVVKDLGSEDDLAKEMSETKISSIDLKVR